MSKVFTTALEALGFFQQRKRAYQLAFNSPAGQDVMRDLAQFCRANSSAFNPDPRVHAALEGRREVWLRIQNHLNLTQEQLFALSTGSNYIANED